MIYENLLKIKSNYSDFFYESIKPGLIKKNRRAVVSLKNKDDELLISIKSNDVVSLRAGINDFLRKIQVLSNTMEVVN